MSNVASPPSPPAPAVAPKAKPTKARRSKAVNVDIVRAKNVLAALPPLLPGIAAKDASAKSVRIDATWTKMYGKLIDNAQQAAAGSGVAKLEQKTATADEQQKGLQLSLLLTDARDMVATHNPDDLAAQQAYGRGEKIDPRRLNALVDIASAYLAAWDGKWRQSALDAGVTPATMAHIQTLRDALSSAGVAQQSVIAANKTVTVDRAAAHAAVREMTAFAVKVVANVFGRSSAQAQSLVDPRPLTNREQARKAATKAKHAAVKTAVKAKKSARLAEPGKRAALVKGRAKRAAVAAQAKKALAALTSATGAKKKATASKPKRTAARAKKPASKAKRAK